jgi:hypothetical protein
MTGLYKSTCSNKSCGTVNPLTSVVLLWTSERDTWSFGTPYSDGCPQSTTAKFSLITDGVRALPPKKALATRSPYSLPEYIFPDLPRDVIHSVLARSDCVSAAWNPSSSPSTCDLCEADDDVQNEQLAIFHCTHPHMTVSLRRRYESLFSRGKSTGCVSTFLHQNNNTLFFYMN